MINTESNSQNEKKAYEYAVFLLSLQLRTVGEIKDKMKNRGYSSDIIEKTINQLLEQKYLNDERYAEVYLENLKKYKTFGYYGIKKKFMEKRLPVQIIESVLNEGLSEEEEMRVAERYTKNYEFGIMNYEEKRKLAQKLKSRGFRGNVIARLVF